MPMIESSKLLNMIPKKHLFIVIISVLICMPVPAVQADAPVEKGTIVFSNEPVEPEYEPAELNRSFNLLDDIYARVFLEKPLKEYYEKLGYDYDYSRDFTKYNYAIQMSVDGNLQSRWFFEATPENFRNMTQFEFILSSKGKDKRFYKINREWVMEVFRMDHGQHIITFEVIPVETALVEGIVYSIATGKFIINVDTTKFDEFAELMAPEIPEPVMILPEIEKEIVQASRMVYPKAEPVQAIIVDNKEGWRYTVDQNNNVLSRSIIATVIYKTATGKCWLKTALYNQRHRGRGRYSQMLYSRPVSGYYNYEILCEQIE